jgi:hypothetical protein
MKYIFTLLVVVFLFSCSKDEDKEAPKIEFVKPLNSDTFSVGVDSFFVNFKLSDNKNLVQYSFVIKDDEDKKFSSGGQFIEGTKYEHKSYVEYGGISGVTKVTLYITAYDRAYNSTVSNKVFYVQP